jgi:hypothetical protein
MSGYNMDDDWITSFAGYDEIEINYCEKQEFNNFENDESSFKETALETALQPKINEENLIIYKTNKSLQINNTNLSTNPCDDYHLFSDIPIHDLSIKEKGLKHVSIDDDNSKDFFESFISDNDSKNELPSFENNFSGFLECKSELLTDRKKNHDSISNSTQNNRLLSKTESISLSSWQSESLVHNFEEEEMNILTFTGENIEEKIEDNEENIEKKIENKEILPIEPINQALEEFNQEIKNLVPVKLSCLKYGQSVCKSVIQALFMKRKDFIVISIVRAHFRMLHHARKNELSRTPSTLDYIDFNNPEQKIKFREFQKHFENNFNVLKKWVSQKIKSDKTNPYGSINGAFCREYFSEKEVRESFFKFLDVVFNEKDFSNLSKRFKIKDDFVENVDMNGKRLFWSMREKFLRELLFLSTK